MHTVLLALILPAVAACQPPATPAPARLVPADSVIDLSDVFAAYDAVGTFVLLDVEAGRRLRHDPQRAATRMTPASTFKVFNALVALETGVVAPDVDSVQFEWDERARRIEGWNQDQSLRMSMRRSTVWVYQEIARRVGEERYHEAFAAEPYGNGDTSCGLDLFWLENCLRISADEQVAFIDRLRGGAAAFSPEVQSAVRELIVLEQGPDHALHAKTGWALRPGVGDIGWLVGWVERDGRSYVFALNLSGAGPGFDMQRARHGVLYAVLARMGLREPRDTDPAPTASPAGRGSLYPPPAPAATDAWLGTDKALHAGASFFLTLGAQFAMANVAGADEASVLPLSAAFALAVGVGKEASDASRGPNPLFSWRDLAADVVGVAIAVLVVAAL